MKPRTLVGSTQRTIVMIVLALDMGAAAKPGRRAARKRIFRRLCFIIAYVHLASVRRIATMANKGKRRQTAQRTGMSCAAADTNVYHAWLG